MRVTLARALSLSLPNKHTPTRVLFKEVQLNVMLNIIHLSSLMNLLLENGGERLRELVTSHRRAAGLPAVQQQPLEAAGGH